MDTLPSSDDADTLRIAPEAPTGDARTIVAGAPPPVPASGFAGQTIGGYAILERIAHGGMGVVYKARQIELNRIVALKVLLAGEQASEHDLLRFRQEAQNAARLRHPHIVPIHEIGVDQGRCYFTMDYIEGRGLNACIAHERWSNERIAALVRKLALALHYAHEQGVIHRDIKPANVLVDLGDEPHLTDFGLAKDLSQDSAITRTGETMGTPAYMSPEQARGDTPAVGPRSDVYALGATLYEMLALRPPFSGKGPLEVMAKLLKDDPLPPRRLQPTVPRDLEVIALKALEKDPARRYQGAAALAGDLGRYLEGRPIKARPLSWPARLARGTWRQRGAVLPLVVLALALAGVGLFERTRPGRVSLRVTPSGAILRQGSRTWTVAEEAISIELPPGAHPIEVTAVGHDPQVRLIEVAPRSAQELRLDLVRQTGRLNLEAEPPGALAIIQGRRHGTPLVELLLPVGRQTVTVTQPLHFDRRIQVDIEKDRLATAFVSLPPARVWELQLADWGGAVLTGDIDGDGVGDFYTISPEGALAAISGRTGHGLKALEGGAAGVVLIRDAGQTRQFHDLDGDGIHELIYWGASAEAGKNELLVYSVKLRQLRWSVPVQGQARFVLVDGPLPPHRGLALVVPGQRVSFHDALDGRLFWERPLQHDTAVSQVEDGDGDGVRDLLLHHYARGVLLSARSGKKLWNLSGPLKRGQTCVLGDGALIVTVDEKNWTWYRPAGGRIRSQASVGPSAGGSDSAQGRNEPRLTIEEGSFPERALALVQERQRHLGLEFLGERGLKCWDLDEGRLRWSRDDMNGATVVVQGDSDRRVLVILHAGRRVLELAEPASGATIWRWEAPEPVDNLHYEPHPRDAGQAQVIVATRTGLHGLDGGSGRLLWSQDAGATITLGPVAEDVDGDGLPEYHVGTIKGRVLAVSPTGELRYALQMPPPIARLEFPDIDHDGYKDLAVSMGDRLVLARFPRLVWQRQLTRAIRPGPLLADLDGDGGNDVLVPVRTADRGSGLIALDGPSGGERFFHTLSHDALRPVALFDLDLDRRPEAACWSLDGPALVFVNLADGREAGRIAVPHYGYAQPAVGDVDGDRLDDIVLAGFMAGEVSLFAGRPLERRWTTALPGACWARPALVDLDGRAGLEVLVLTAQGWLAALDGRSGAVLWEVELKWPRAREDGQNDWIPIQTRSEIAVSRPAAGAPLMLAIAASDGMLFLVEAASGVPARIQPVDISLSSTPQWVDVEPDGVKELIFGTSRGLACVDVDIDGGRLRWRTERDDLGAVDGPVHLCDLEGDGALEAIGGSLAGQVICVDAREGTLRWTYPMSGKVEGAVQTADMDGDGILDVILTDQSGRISCLSGRQRNAGR